MQASNIPHAKSHAPLDYVILSHVTINRNVKLRFHMYLELISKVTLSTESCIIHENNWRHFGQQPLTCNRLVSRFWVRRCLFQRTITLVKP